MKRAPSLGERMRLKDRILDSIATAIKQIQELQFRSQEESDTIILTNEHRQLQRLCEHLDHAFLHGLRHITNGYWVVVQEFTHKDICKEIKRNQNVTTNLGRGRSWLYCALNDNLLESYIRCFRENMKFVKKYYVREALLLDQQRVELLLSLAAGLEFVTFQLQSDAPYLDLATHLPYRRDSEEQEDDDRLSLCSMDSSISHTSSVTSLTTPDSIKGLADFDTSTSPYSFDCIRVTPSPQTIRAMECIMEDKENSGMQNSSMDAEQLRDQEESRISRISRISQIDMGDIYEDNPDGSSLEVIHVKSRTSKQKRKKMGKKKNAVIEGDPTTPETPESMDRDLSILMQEDSASERLVRSNDDCMSEKTDCDKTIDCDNMDIRQISNEERTKMEHTTQMEMSEANLEEAHNLGSEISDCNKENVLKDNDIVYSLQESHESHIAPEPVYVQSRLSDNHDNRDSSHGNSCYDDDSHLKLQSPKTDSSSNITESQSIECLQNDVSGCHGDGMADVPPGGDKTNQENCIDTELEIPKPVSVDVDRSAKEKGEKNDMLLSHSKKDGKGGQEFEVKVDNNTMLFLMLDVFESQEEKFLKMFIMSTGHSEGSLQPICVLLTSCAIYILSNTSPKSRFIKEAVIPYQELDYLSLSINYQSINIVCTNRRKQFWLSTGDQALTKYVVNQIDIAVRRSDRNLPRLSILSDATTQKIALRKWAAQDCQCQPQEVQIMSFSLIHWECLLLDGKTHGAGKQGFLLCRFHGPSATLSGGGWEPGFFVLSDGALYQYSDQENSTAPSLCLQLSGDECTGCRRSKQTERPYCFEVIIAGGSILQLAAPNETEAQDWLLALCQTVAEGQQLRVPPNGGSLPCCCVLTPQKLLMCHEDVTTNFFRTLGMAQVSDITGLLLDSSVETYCVLDFDSQEPGVSSEKWIVFFNGALERSQFIEALAQAWKLIFEVDLTLSDLQDVSLRKKCREGLALIRKYSYNGLGPGLKTPV